MSSEWRDKVVAARTEHDGSVIDWPGDHYGWMCACGAGRARHQNSSDWETAARELSAHQTGAIIAALALPELQLQADATLFEVDRLRALIRGKDLEIAQLRRERDVWREDSSPTIEGSPGTFVGRAEQDWDDRHQYDDAS